jgi:hypothetical protein
MAVYDDLMALEFSPSNVSQRHEPPGPALPTGPGVVLSIVCIWRR